MTTGDRDRTNWANLPTRIAGMHSTFRLANGVELSGRAEYSGGNWLLDNASRNLAANGAWPVCNKAYQNLKDGHRELLTAYERLWCNQVTVPIDGPIWLANFIRLRALTLVVPLPGNFLGQHSTTASISARNYLLWKDSRMKVFDPEMVGRDGMNSPVRTIEAQVPPAAGITLAIKASYW